MLIQGTITTIAYGGKGILRTPDHMVVFVPFTAVGDEIECRLIRIKKNYAEGEIVRIIRQGSNRIKPLCPYFGICGGCQLQHLNYQSQIQHKKEVVEGSLRRVYPEVAVSISAANPIWAYRRHVTLSIKRNQAGYYTQDNKTLIEIDSCDIFCEKEDSIFKRVKEFVAELEPVSGEAKVKILKTSPREYILYFHFKQLPQNFSRIAKKNLGNEIVGICGSSEQNKISFGNSEISFSVAGTSFTAHPSAFLQVHAEQSELIYEEIRSYMRQCPSKLLIDLYCGIGISSILSAPFSESISGIEMNKTAIKYAKINAELAGVKNVLFQADKVEECLDMLLKKQPDTAIINPPREGIEPLTAVKLASSSLKRIFYISCQPATLARDLEVFKNKGFNLEKAQAFDMFPQTGHVETLVSLTRKPH